MDDWYVIVFVAIAIIKIVTAFFTKDDSKTILTTEPEEEEEQLQPLTNGEVTTIASPTTIETRSNQQAWNKQKAKAATRHQSTERNAAPTVSVTQTEEENNETFQINSVEEARKAIIWGEILQRKY